MTTISRKPRKKASPPLMLGEINLAKIPHPQGIARTIREVALAFGVSYQLVRVNWRTVGMPVEPNGTYDLERIFFWKVGRNQDPDRERILREHGIYRGDYWRHGIE